MCVCVCVCVYVCVCMCVLRTGKGYGVALVVTALYSGSYGFESRASTFSCISLVSRVAVAAQTFGGEDGTLAHNTGKPPQSIQWQKERKKLKKVKILPAAGINWVGLLESLVAIFFVFV